MILENYKDLLATTASITTICQFLTGILVCQKYVRGGTTGDTSGFPFVAAFLSCSLWLRYGFLIQDSSLILVNTFGASLQLAYVFTYYLYCVKKSLVLKQILTVSVILITTLVYTQYETDVLKAKYFVGLLCCCMTVVFFAAPLTILAHVMKVKSSESLPFSIILSSFAVSGQWFLYGCILDDPFIQIPNGLGCLLSAFQLSLFAIYPSEPSKPQQRYPETY